MATVLRQAAALRHAVGLRQAALRRQPGVLHQALTLISGAVKLERSMHQLLHRDSQATLRRMVEKAPGLGQRLKRASGYVVFPSIGQASAVLGTAYGLGELFEHGRLSGYAVTVRVTLGVQLGGQTFSELIVFEDAAALNRFKRGTVTFVANASAVLVKAGATASRGLRDGAAVFVRSEGGLMLEADLGVQAFAVGPAVLTRARSAKLA
jgi:lipid-binding SYLF domain-containing protein